MELMQRFGLFREEHDDDPLIVIHNAYNHTKLIGLPKGMGYKGLTVAPAGTIVNECNLDQWTVTTTN